MKQKRFHSKRKLLFSSIFLDIILRPDRDATCCATDHIRKHIPRRTRRDVACNVSHTPCSYTRRSTLRLYNGKWTCESLPTHGHTNATHCVPTWDSLYSMGLRGNARKDTESYVSTPGIKTNQIKYIN